MTGKVIAVANMKGGVGKTATVVGLAEALAASGAQTLVIDLDPQANASICLAGDSVLKQLIEGGKTIDGFLEDRIFKKRNTNFDDCIRSNVSNVRHTNHMQLPISLLASSSELRLVERELIFRLTRAERNLDWIVEQLYAAIRDQLRYTRNNYDYILFDCAPGISALTEVSVRLADMVIVPTIPDFLSTYGLQSFCSNLWTGEIAKQSTLKKPKKKPHVLITRRRPIKEHARTTEKLLNERHKERPSFLLLETEIPEMAAIADALGRIQGAPTILQKWRAGSAAILASLSKEIKGALHGA
ncbi:MAG: AAA family ATPase [Hyphomicrobiales bacterium]